MGCGRRHGRVVGQMAGFPNSGILPCSAVGALLVRPLLVLPRMVFSHARSAQKFCPYIGPTESPD